MKTAIISISILILIAFYGFNRINNKSKSNEEGIQFYHGTLQEAINKAKEEKKMIFLDAYASWCGPCKMMKNSTFKDKEVSDFYNKNFVNLAIDMEKGEGPTLARNYSITGYPTLIYLNREGKVILKTMGFHDVNDFIEVGQKALTN